MGVLLSRFRRKQTTIEVLEGIDKEINRLQKNRKVNQDRQKQFVTSLLIYSIVVYIIAAVIFFLVYFPDTWQLRLLYSLPLLVFPFLIWCLKKLLHWYFVKRISSNDLALQQLRERKKQILEDVMETETYKRAREILEKFDPTRLRKLEISSPESERTNVNVSATPGTVIQQRTVRTTQHIRGAASVSSRLPAPASQSQTPTPVRLRQLGAPLTPTSPVAQPQFRPPQIRSPLPSQIRTPAPAQRTPVAQQTRAPFPAQPMIRGGFNAAPPGIPMPRSVLPRERGTMDKLMDYLVGDGPENRYALICQSCYSHNGMALKEEFEYLSFRCCYCYSINPAKKQRPLAPKLEFFAPTGHRKGRATGVSPSNEESDDDDVDNEDDYSDHDSMESDESAGGSAIKPASSPAASASASSTASNSSKALEPSEPKDGGPSHTPATSGPESRETTRSGSPYKSRLIPAEGHKATAGQAPTTTGIPIPKTQPGLASKLPVTKPNGKEASTELKDIPQASKTTERSSLPRTVPIKISSEISKDQRIPVPISNVGVSPAVSVTGPCAEDSNRNKSSDIGASQTKATSGSVLATPTPGAASLDS